MAGNKRRNRWTFLGGLLLWTFAALMMFMFGTQKKNHLWDLFSVASFVLAICYAPTLLTMFSWVRLTPVALIIQNPTARWIIPWSLMGRVSGDGGLFVEVKGKPEPLRSTAFQGSLVGRMAGSPSSRKVAAEIESYRRQLSRAGSGKVQTSFPWGAHAFWILLGWMVFALVMPMLGRYTT